MKLRLTLLSVLAACAAMLTFTGPAAAATGSPAAARPSGTISQNIPCTMQGAASTCTLTVTAFRDIDGTLNAIGTVTGGGTTVPFQTPAQATGSCSILNLTLGPLHLDLLGLVVDLNQVNLNITAQQGPGNLLGNLLCAVANLLNNPGNTTAGVTNLLNRILGVLGSA